MERDTRRDRGQWRGCHAFKDITCDGDNGSSTRRDGGLKMGQTYYYYVSVQGTHEYVSWLTVCFSTSWMERPRCMTRHYRLQVTALTYQAKLSTHYGFPSSKVCGNEVRLSTRCGTQT
jgi:hypothetical protein